MFILVQTARVTSPIRLPSLTRQKPLEAFGAVISCTQEKEHASGEQLSEVAHRAADVPSESEVNDYLLPMENVVRAVRADALQRFKLIDGRR